MTLSSASTTAEIYAAFENATDYDITNDIAKARQLVQAGRMLLARVPSKQGRGSDSYEVDLNIVQQQIDEALSWLRQVDTDNLPDPGRDSVRNLSLRNYRS